VARYVEVVPLFADTHRPMPGIRWTWDRRTGLVRDRKRPKDGWGWTTVQIRPERHNSTDVRSK
jgi:hypothetical protein